jgi:nucleotide-binding universal stress UspA family protein
MKIVVPTDFSDYSKIALQFAAAFARQVPSELILLHVLPSLGPTVSHLPAAFLKQEMLEWVQNEFSRLMAEVNTNGLAVTHEIAYGAGVEKVIEPFTQTHAIDLIIMGSKGASGLKKFLVGSNTVGVINNSSIPVLVVPELTAIAAISHLLYASDLKNVGEEVKALLPFARLLQVAIKIIHVPPLEYLLHIDTERLINNLREETAYHAIEVELVAGEDIVNAIEQYAAGSTGEILAMFTRSCSFLEQLFSKSITREIAWHNKVPLLVINNR